MFSCRMCGGGSISPQVNLGDQAISNRFLRDAHESEALFPLALGQCPKCGLVQLETPPPAVEILPRFSWITYNEPEEHLDDLARTIAQLPGVNSQTVIWGLSFKDDSLLKRMNGLGFGSTYRIDPARELGITTPGAAVEMVQDQLDASRAQAIAEKTGLPGVIIARHIFEHAQKLQEFVAGLASVITPGEYIVAEVPDCLAALKAGDCTTIWEERASYFSAASFAGLFPAAGLECIWSATIPRTFENLLLGIGRTGTSNRSGPAGSATSAAAEANLLSDFARAMDRHRTGAKTWLGQFRKHHGAVAVLGAGHLACAFINYLGLSEHIAFIADDNPNKLGLLMAGSKLPIRPSATLVQKKVGLCLLSVNPEAEDRVMQRNAKFIEAGGRFGSIFPSSSRYFLNLPAL